MEAALLVVSEVRAWERIEGSHSFNSINEFNDWLTSYLSGRNISGPTAFKLTVLEEEAAWHVITPPKENQDHKEAGKKFNNKGSFQVVGFYSQSHAGVFTHQGSSTHMHFVDNSKKFAGHLDGISATNGFVLFLPANE